MPQIERGSLEPFRTMFNYFKGGEPETLPRVRYHLAISEAERYKSNCERLTEALGS